MINKEFVKKFVPFAMKCFFFNFRHLCSNLRIFDSEKEESKWKICIFPPFSVVVTPYIL